MFPYKFQKNRTINKNFTILSRQTVGRGPTILNFIIVKHLKMLRFKFQQNRTMNEEFNFFGGRERKGCLVRIVILLTRLTKIICFISLSKMLLFLGIMWSQFEPLKPSVQYCHKSVGIGCPRFESRTTLSRHHVFSIGAPIPSLLYCYKVGENWVSLAERKFRYFGYLCVFFLSGFIK